MKEFVNAPVVDEDYKPKAKKKKPKARKKTIPKAQRLKLIRKHMRLNKVYKRLMKKKELTDAQKQQKADIRKEGLALVEEFKHTPFKHKMDLDAFNEK